MPHFTLFPKYHISDVTVDSSQKGKVSKWKIVQKNIIFKSFKISVKSPEGLNVPDFKLEIEIPTYRDTEEYIDEFLESILNENLKYSAEWEFC